MRETFSRYALILFLCAAVLPASAAAKPHVLSFGKWTTVQVSLDSGETIRADVKIRPLYWDGVTKEFTTGDLHDITDRLFVVRRAYRLNDSLPGEKSSSQQWVWRLGDWLLVNRLSGKITQLSLPAFHPVFSEVSWYRDYAAYCGVSDDNSALYAVVAQVGNKKPVLRKELGPTTQSSLQELECAPAVWERRPAKVTFMPKRFPHVSYTVVGRSADLAADETDD